MSDNLDKFVLEYIVETRDSLKRLEQLTQKMDDVEKKGGKGKSSLKEIGNSLKSLAGEAGGAGEAVAGLTEGLAGLAAVAGPIAAVIAVILILKKVLQETKGVMDELTSQRDLGAKIGMSALSVENITRNVTRAKGSQVDQSGAEDILSKLANKLRNAYTDPTQMNRDALILRQTGVSINGASGGMNDTQTALQQLSEKLKDVSEEQAHAYGRLFDLTNQQVDVMRQQGAAIADTTHLTAAEAEARQKALEKTNELKAASNDLSEHWRELKDDILVHVIPALDMLVKFFDKIVNLGEKVGNMVHGAFDRGWNFTKNHFGNFGRDSKDLFTGNFKKFSTDIASEWKDSGKTFGMSAKDIKDSADKSNQTSLKMETDLDRIINLFSQSVSQFSNTIDERQAWAAWAGEIGRSNGLGLSGNRPLGLTGTAGNAAAFDPTAQAQLQGSSGAPAPSASTAPIAPNRISADLHAIYKSGRDIHDYDELYKQAAAATGLPAEFIKRVAMAESNQNPLAIGMKKDKKGNLIPSGAVGMMQIMPGNLKSLNITDVRNPQQNIMGGAKLLKQLVNEYGNYDDALRAYNGGQNRDHWNNPETAAYVGRVMAQNATIPGAVAAGSGGDANALISPQMRYALDPKAKPQFTFSGKKLIDPSAGGESREKSQLLDIQNMLAQQIGVPLAQVQTGSVSVGDEKYAAANMMAQLSNSRITLKNQLDVPGMTQMQRGGLEAQLRTTDLQIQGMMRYMPQIQAQAQPGDRSITIGQGAVQVIVEGTNLSAKQIAEEINNTFADHVNEVANGMADGVSH